MALPALQLDRVFCGAGAGAGAAAGAAVDDGRGEALLLCI